MKLWWFLLICLLIPAWVDAAPELQTVEDEWLIVDSQPAAGGTEQTVEDTWLIVDSQPADGGTVQTVEDVWLICDYSSPTLRIKIRQN